jgi:hypothetical protein
VTKNRRAKATAIAPVAISRTKRTQVASPSGVVPISLEMTWSGSESNGIVGSALSIFPVFPNANRFTLLLEMLWLHVSALA